MSRRRWLLSILQISCMVSLKLSAQANPQLPAATAQRLPIRIGVVIDESGSARDSGLQVKLLQRALDWTNTALKRDGGDAFLVGFNDQVIISTELVTDVDRLQRAADQLRPIGGSAVRDALVHSVQKFDSVQPEPEHAMRLILFISDGFDNASNAKERNAIEAAKRCNVRVYALGFPSSEAEKGHHFLDTIAKQTGGKAFFPASEAEMTSALADIDRDLAISSH